MLDIFHGSGAFSREELAEVLKTYHLGAKHNFVTTIHLGDVGPKLQGLVNEHNQMLGNLIDRLILTLDAQGLEGHAGDCSVYSSLSNGNPEDGVCTCGYGLQQMRNGNNSEMYSKELGDRLCGGVIK